MIILKSIGVILPSENLLGVTETAADVDVTQKLNFV